MDLICPSCQKRLTIEDRYAGMVVKCPMCSGMLQAPVLPATVPASPPPPTAMAPAVSPPTMVAPPPAAPAPARKTKAEMPIVPPLPSSPPSVDVTEVVEDAAMPSIRTGDYTKSIRWHLRADILAWIVPGCIAAMFFLSFFTWYVREDYSLNLWELAFTMRGYSIYTFYTVVLIFLAMPVAGVVCALENRWIPLPGALRPYWPYRTLVVGGMIALPLLFFVGDYVDLQFLPVGTRPAIALKLAFRLHLVAVAASALQFWLELRQAKGAPLPRFTLRW